MVLVDLRRPSRRTGTAQDEGAGGKPGLDVPEIGVLAEDDHRAAPAYEVPQGLGLAPDPVGNGAVPRGEGGDDEEIAAIEVPALPVAVSGEIDELDVEARRDLPEEGPPRGVVLPEEDGRPPLPVKGAGGSGAKGGGEKGGEEEAKLSRGHLRLSQNPAKKP